MTKRYLHANISGSGPVIVLLHGFLSSSHYYKHVAPQLAKNHTVVTLDLLGFGQSPVPKEEIGYNEHVEAIHKTLQHLGITQPVTLLGHSMGALIAARYGATFSQDVAKLLLYNPPIFEDAKQAREAFAKTGKHYQSLLYSKRRRLYWSLMKLMPRNTSKQRGPINFADSMRTSFQAREGGFRDIILQSTLLTDIRQTAIPTSLVVGRYDRLVYQEVLRRYDLPDHITLTLLNTGHHPLIRNPDIIKQLLIPSLQRSI